MSRRTLLRAAAAVAAPTVLLSPKSGWAADIRPDVVDPQFWTSPRSVRLVNANTNTSLEALYWADGAYVMDGYYAISAALYDHHADAAVQLEPGVINLVYATQRWYEGAERTKAKTIISSGYRTLRTNILVGGVPGGQHPKAAALDGRLVGVSLDVYARMLRVFGSGGVGLYARHVHWDVGRPPVFWRGKQRES